MSAPPSPHFSAPAPHFSAPAHVPGALPSAAGARSFVALPPVVHLATPSGAGRPAIGNAVGAMATPHVTIGFPSSQGLASQAPAQFVGTRGRESGTLRFSGEGHEIWRDSSVGAAPVAGLHPRRPVSPLEGWGRRPRYGNYGIAYGFGAPFFGFGLGWAGGLWLGNAWGPGTCDPYWAGGIGCGGLFYNDYGYGNYGPGIYGPGNVGSQVEAQPYENSGSPPVAYGASGQQLVQLYLKDGTVYEVTDYWLVKGDELHFTTVDGSGNETEHAVNFDQLDLQKTIGVNTDRGFRFVLRDEPMQEYLQGTEQQGVGVKRQENGPDRNAPATPGQPE
jgi:hypothetical protein